MKAQINVDFSDINGAEAIYDVGCTLCGKCCPPSCVHLKDNLCAIHPSQHTVDSMYGACELKPFELVQYFGIHCPPAVSKIAELTGITIQESVSDSRFCNETDLQNALALLLNH